VNSQASYLEPTAVLYDEVTSISSGMRIERWEGWQAGSYKRGDRAEAVVFASSSFAAEFDPPATKACLLN